MGDWGWWYLPCSSNNGWRKVGERHSWTYRSYRVEVSIGLSNGPGDALHGRLVCPCCSNECVHTYLLLWLQWCVLRLCWCSALHTKPSFWRPFSAGLCVLGVGIGCIHSCLWNWRYMLCLENALRVGVWIRVFVLIGLFKGSWNKISFESFAELIEDVEEIKGAISGAEVSGFNFEGLCAPMASCGAGFTDILA